MKNIHVLPADKPSRLLWCFEDKRHYTSIDEIYFKNQKELENQNIYITNSEEIKDKCYVLCSTSIGALYLDGVINTASMLAEGEWKKVILTTDQDLIKDGVQAIDDEFLEWFVKNPSCEEVEVVEGDMINGEYTFGKYHIGRMYYADEPKEEPKQETLEEVVNNFKKTDVYINDIKQEQKRSYSEEEVLSIVHVSCEEGMYIQRTINDKVSIPAKRIKDFQNKVLENYNNK